jgi:putative CocE/NonD family hydrolase
MTNWFTAHLMHHTVGRASQNLPNGWQVNTLHFWLGNNLDSGAFRGAQAQWDRITVPMLTVGNWTGFGLHLRGNTEAFMRAASKHKKLRIQNGSHVHPFYTEEGRQDQIRFFDYWLKGIDNGVMDEPPVKLAIRKGRDEIEWRYEHEWPLKRTRWQKLYFDLSPPAAGMPANAAGLVSTNPDKMHSRTYDATSLGSMGSTSAASSQVMGGGIKPGMGIALETPPLPQDVEVTGPLAASFWVSSSTEDMDLFLTLRNFDADGNEVLETGQQGTPVPVAKGWLRVSHRELDPELSRPYRPYHKHTRRQYLKPGEIVKVDVEIWPTSMVFRRGHRIRLDIQPRDGVGSQSYMHYHADYNTGTNTIYAGGERESYLLLPVIPAK